MSFHNGVKSRTYIASDDLSGHLNHIVKISADLKILGGSAGKGVGVLQNKPLNGEHASVAIEGEVEVRAAVALTADAMVTSVASGWASPVASTTACDVLGRVVKGCASGMLAVIELKPYFGSTA
jgi:hypothetical protein